MDDFVPGKGGRDVSRLNLIAVDCYGHPKKYMQKCFFVAKICCFQAHSLHTPTPLGDGGLSHFSECSYRRYLGQIGILGGNWHFR